MNWIAKTLIGGGRVGAFKAAGMCLIISREQHLGPEGLRRLRTPESRRGKDVANCSISLETANPLPRLNSSAKQRTAKLICRLDDSVNLIRSDQWSRSIMNQHDIGSATFPIL